jgi:hypothetical protein
MAMGAAATMLVALILCLAFAGAGGPVGYTGGPITIRAFAPPGTTFVAGLNALLNIVYTCVVDVYAADLVLS